MPGSLQAVLDLVPEAGLLEAGLDDLVEIGLGRGKAVDARAVGDVLVDRLRERVRLLEHHADAGAQLHHVERLDRRCPRRRCVILPVTRAIAMVSFMRLMQRRNVDLPQPDGPMKAVTALIADVDDRRSYSACFSP